VLIKVGNKAIFSLEIVGNYKDIFFISLFVGD